MPTDDFAGAACPLFEEGIVEAVEWSFDMSWRTAVLPDWAEELLNHYSDEGALFGHGVSYSVLSARWSAWQERYLNLLKEEVAKRRYLRISEHFGFARGGQFEHNTVMPVPFSFEAIRCGVENLRKLANAAGVQIGLENLALAFGPDDVRNQGAFLHELLNPVGGYLVLDLHNIWCQMRNFNLTFEEAVASYPLERVQELHVAGGSWDVRNDRTIRRDTHDDKVPDAVFDLVSLALNHCPNVDLVIFERLGNTIRSTSDAAEFQSDFRKLCGFVASHDGTGKSLLPGGPSLSPAIDDDHHSLCLFQDRLMDSLAAANSASEFRSLMNTYDDLTLYDQYLSSFEDEMIEVGALLARKWGVVQGARGTPAVG